MYGHTFERVPGRLLLGPPHDVDQVSGLCLRYDLAQDKNRLMLRIVVGPLAVGPEHLLVPRQSATLDREFAHLGFGLLERHPVATEKEGDPADRQWLVSHRARVHCARPSHLRWT